MRHRQLTDDMVARAMGKPVAKTGLRAALYLRVSTEEQSAKNQRPELARMAKARGLKIVREYVETQSAAKRRPVFDEMMSDAHRGTFDVLLIWAIDRFGRSMVGNLELIVKLDSYGTRVVSAREEWLDTGSPARMLLVGIFSWVAEQERRRLSERTIAGMQRARDAGRSVGRPRAHVPLGIVRDLLGAGHSRSYVARQLGTSPASLARALERSTPPKGVSPADAPK